MNLTESEENYIKSIYHLHVPGQGVSATMLATSVQTKAASVTDMLKRLHRKKLINYKPYHNFSLSDLGTHSPPGYISRFTVFRSAWRPHSRPQWKN